LTKEEVNIGVFRANIMERNE